MKTLKKQNKKSKKQVKDVVKDIIVKEIKSDDNILIEEPIIIEDNSKIVEESQEKKELCKVLLAKPNYFVINKNGEEIIVYEQNNYHRGEEILY